MPSTMVTVDSRWPGTANGATDARIGMPAIGRMPLIAFWSATVSGGSAFLSGFLSGFGASGA